MPKDIKTERRELLVTVAIGGQCNIESSREEKKGGKRTPKGGQHNRLMDPVHHNCSCQRPQKVLSCCCRPMPPAEYSRPGITQYNIAHFYEELPKPAV
jgi:hypothetical protein